MKRRAFIAGLGSAAAWPFVARAQLPKKMPTIGFLGSATPETWKSWVAAFEERLGQHGWVSGRTIAIEYRWAEGRPERYAELAGDLVRMKVDVIVTGGAPALEARKVTSTAPTRS